MDTKPAPSPPRIGESHNVAVVLAEPVGPDWLVTFGDLDRPHRTYRDAYSTAEFAGIAASPRGTLTLIRSRTFRAGKWAYAAAGGGGDPPPASS